MIRFSTYLFVLVIQAFRSFKGGSAFTIFMVSMLTVMMRFMNGLLIV